MTSFGKYISCQLFPLLHKVRINEGKLYCLRNADEVHNVMLLLASNRGEDEVGWQRDVMTDRKDHTNRQNQHLCSHHFYVIQATRFLC